MAISITCPGCQSVYAIPENLAGKTIRCKKCGEMVAVTAESTAPTAAPVAAKPVAAKPIAAKPAARVVDDSDVAIPARPRRVRDEDDELPRDRPAKKGAKLPLILGGVIGALVVGAGGIGALFATGVLGGKTETNEVSAVPPPGQSGMAAVTRPGGGEDTEKPEKSPTQKQPPRKDGGTSKPPLVVNPLKPIEQPTTSTPTTNASTVSPERMMSGQMDRIAADKVARATVLIWGEGHNGSKWTGSGWFGMEPGLIFTNSHVLDMKAPDSKPPAKLTIYTYKPDTVSGARIVVDKEIPHSKIKILGIDRHNDLAVLQIMNEPDLPAPLKVRPSSQLQVRQGVTTFGFPLTDVLQMIGDLSRDKMPEMSVRPTNITALRYDSLGRPKYVQTEGAQNSGNSGGPIVDAEGNVIAVVVAGVLQQGGRTQLSLSVPTEWVFGLLAGRADEVETDQPYRKDGKIRIPVTVKCLDPLKRLRKVGLEYWVGDKAKDPRPQGEKKPEKLPSDTDHQVADLKYDVEKKQATGELVFPEPPADRVFWTQAYYTNAIQPDGYYLPGLPVKMTGPPVDRVPANLIVKLPRGAVRNIDLTNSSDLTEFEEGEGQSKNERGLVTTTVALTETVGAGNAKAGSAATLGFKYQSLDLKAERGQVKVDLLPKRILTILNDNIKKMEAMAQVNAHGETFHYQSNTRGIPEQRLSWLFHRFSDEAMEALQFCSISLPNKPVQPLEKWETKKVGRLYKLDLDAARNDLFPPGEGEEPTPGGPPPAKKGNAQVKARELKFEQKITYTYLGMRNRLGKQEAVIRVEGTVGKAPGAKETASGEIKGYAMVDIDTGTVVFAEIESEYEVDSSSGGHRLKVSGLNKYKLNRGSSVK